MNMNDLFDKLTNFKIKHTKNPTPTEISNMRISISARGQMYNRVEIDKIYRLENELIINFSEDLDDYI